uniref:Uncharacterized protein n=1 Tax=Acrobeloides nanus TaxID=290746 RepID=A0A914C1L5_9BILA
MLGCQLTCCCTPSPPTTPSGSTRKFFETLDPMNGFKDRDDFETYLYNQSYKIEPKAPNRLEIVEPKRPSECLKSPGIKLPKQHANSSTLNSQRHHRSRSRMNEQKSSPTINNSPHSASPFTPFINSPFSAEQDFGIVEINPGQAPRYIGDSGRVNQAFSVDTPLSTPAFSMPPKTPTSPRQFPGSSQFFFPSTKPPAPPPPSEPKIVLQNPPSRRYGTHRPPAPLPSTSSTDHPPLLPRKSKIQQPSTSNGRYSPDAENEPHANDELQEVAANQINNNNQNDQSTSASMLESSPSVPPRVSAKHLPPPLNTNELAELIDNRVPSPRSPTVSILVPLPPTPPELPPRRVIASASTPLFEFEAPPRPPKPRWMESRSATPNSIGQPEDDLPPAPPLPPKTYQRFTRNS